MKLFKSLLLSVLFVAALSFIGCNEEPTTSVTPETTPGLSKLTLPAGAVISSATFNVYIDQNQDRMVTVHKVNVPWVEATETYNIFFNRTAPQWDPASLGSFNANTTGYKSVDITALVQSWIADPTTNFGILLDQPSWLNCPDPTTGDIQLIYYQSRENVNVPYLEVTYTVGGGSPVTVQEPAFGDTYLHSNDPDYAFGAVSVLFQTRWDEPNCFYEKLPLFYFDIEQGTTETECETAYAKGNLGANTHCISEYPGVNNWGWTNYISNVSADFSYDWPIYAGAAQCDETKGTLVGTLHVDYYAAGDSLTVEYDITGPCILDVTHLWVSEDSPLPIKKLNPLKYTSAPGQFNYNFQNPVTVYDLDGPFWIAAHSVVCCPSEE